MNIAVGILNWNRDASQTIGSLKGFAGKVIVCSNDVDIAPLLPEVESVKIIPCPENIAKAKNVIINSAREIGATHLFIIEDDIAVKDISVFEKYVELMNTFDIGLTFFGYTNANMVLDGKPNPCIIVKIDQSGSEICCNRHCCSAVFGIDLERNKLMFNEELLVMEHEEYLQRCTDAGVIPFNGFYIDLPESWKYFERLPVKTERVKTVELAKMDRKMMDDAKVVLHLESSADKFLAFVKKAVKAS